MIIKIRHPDVLEKMDVDIRILYSITNFVGKLGFLNNIKMPMTFIEFRRVLIS